MDKKHEVVKIDNPIDMTEVIKKMKKYRKIKDKIRQKAFKK